MTTTRKTRYERDGYLAPVRIISEQEAAHHRNILESAEAENGPMHYRFKIHTIMRSPYELATHPKLLDVVEELLGPNILLYNVTYIIKEAHSDAHVSWHQDLTYWGLSSDTQVSAWLALSPATETSGCMYMLPGSHCDGQVAHQMTQDPSNVLFHGQTVPGIDMRQAQPLPLQPGEASFHHGWTLHTSMPNHSDDRRIGLNIQYLAPEVRQLKHSQDSALLVRGIDRYRHFQQDIPAQSVFDDTALSHQQAMNDKLLSIYRV